MFLDFFWPITAARPWTPSPSGGVVVAPSRLGARCAARAEPPVSATRPAAVVRGLVGLLRPGRGVLLLRHFESVGAAVFFMEL